MFCYNKKFLKKSTTMIGYLSSADVFTWDNFSFQWQGEHQHNSIAKAAVTSYVVVKSSFGKDSLI